MNTQLYISSLFVHKYTLRHRQREKINHFMHFSMLPCYACYQPMSRNILHILCLLALQNIYNIYNFIFVFTHANVSSMINVFLNPAFLVTLQIHFYLTVTPGHTCQDKNKYCCDGKRFKTLRTLIQWHLKDFLNTTEKTIVKQKPALTQP